jgi:hypothetical protein
MSGGINFGSIGAFAGFIGGVASKAMNHRQRGLEQAAHLIQVEAQRALGTYDYGWEQLAPSTQDDRVKKGYPANEPGLRSGEMRNSIHTRTHDGEASIGSDDIKLVWFENGRVSTPRQPPRPVLAPAARRTEHEVRAILSRGLLASIISSVRAP